MDQAQQMAWHMVWPDTSIYYCGQHVSEAAKRQIEGKEKKVPPTDRPILHNKFKVSPTLA